VVGAGTKTGIYKITNLTNGMAYIGQSRNIKDRWADHIKVGLGADTVTRNKLYPAMLSTGVENFTFEILEICSAEELNEREKFYIDFYDTVNYGYNVTKGGS
jgi:group I intron endonuclease